MSTDPMTLDASEKAGVPVVRRLDWRDLTSPREDGPPEPTGDIDAQTMFGEYSVCVDEAAIDDAGDDWKWCVWTPVESLGHFADLDEAKAAAQADYEQRITAALNPDYVSALDTARAEIERLRERLRDIIDERDNLSTIIATEIDDVAGVELDDMEERATRAESALTAAQARIAELERTVEFVQRWAWRESPATDAERMSVIKYHPGIRPAATLSPAVKEPK